VATTESGRLLYTHARQILRHVEIVRDDCSNLARGLAGEVSIGFPPVLSPLLSYRLFSRVRKSYPGVKLKLVDASSRHLREFVQNGRLDIALLFVDQSERMFRADVLVEEELFYVSADGSRTSMTLEELSTVDLLLPNRDSRITALVTSEMAARGLPLSPLGEIDSISTLLQAAAEGLAGTVLPWAALYNEGLSDLLHYAKFTDVRMVRPISLCTPCALAESLAVSAVADVLSTLVRDLVESGRWKGTTPARNCSKNMRRCINGTMRERLR
jgi:LysR family nitrogen assimilation transcriptional regulator